jgi:hypothetical protein
MLIPMDLLGRDILNTLEQSVLDPTIIVTAVEKAIQTLKEPTVDLDTRRDTLKKELTHIDNELARLTMAIAGGGPLATLLAAVKDREGRRSHLLAELASIEAAGLAEFDPAAIEQELRSYLADWPRVAQAPCPDAATASETPFPSHSRVA